MISGNDSNHGVRINHRALSYYTRLRKVQEYVARHYPKKISLEDAARVADLEKTYFSTFFRQKVGVPFTTWLSYYRVKKAIKLMEDGACGIGEVARAVGYRDLKTCARAFKKFTQLTPSELREKVTNQRLD